jgi:hypothetical protein
MERGKLRNWPQERAAHGGGAVLPPVIALVELSVILLAIVGIDYVFPKLGITELQPNVFWIPILLLSLHYGTVSGLLAAAAAIAVVLLQGVPDQNVGENHFAYLLRIWAEPILWIGVALLLGQFRMRQIERKNELAYQLHEALSQRAAIADYSTNLRARCASLERELVGRTEPPAQQLLSTLDRLQSGLDLPTAFADSIRLTFGEAQASIHLIEGDTLRRVATTRSEAATHTKPLRAAIDSGHPLFRSVVAMGETPSVLVRGDEAKLDGEGLVAVPLRGLDGAVVGMLKLEDAPAAALGNATVSALQLIAQMAASGLRRSHEAAPATVDDSARAEADAPSLRSRFLRSIRLIPTTGAAVRAEEPLAYGARQPKRTVH